MYKYFFLCPRLSAWQCTAQYRAVTIVGPTVRYGAVQYLDLLVGKIGIYASSRSRSGSKNSFLAPDLVLALPLV
jgi:hypothetical protein